MSRTAITAEPGIGPRDLTTTIDRHEAGNGGTWRYLQTDAEGNAYGFHGVFHGVFHGESSPDGIVQTFEFEGASGHVCRQTATLADRGGKTLVRTVSAFQSVEDRDAMVASWHGARCPRFRRAPGRAARPAAGKMTSPPAIKGSRP